MWPSTGHDWSPQEGNDGPPALGVVLKAREVPRVVLVAPRRRVAEGEEGERPGGRGARRDGEANPLNIS